MPTGLSKGTAYTANVQGVYGIGGGVQTSVNVPGGGGEIGGSGDTKIAAGEYISAGAVGAQKSLTIASPSLLL